MAAVSLRKAKAPIGSLPSTSRSSGQFKSWAKRLKTDSALSYIEAAIIDFEVCRNADWFVGWSGSSFARTLAQFQSHEHGRGWFSACPDGLRKSTGREIHLRYWGLCNESAASWKQWPGPNPKRVQHRSMNKCWLGARTAAIAGDNHTRASAQTPSNASARTENSFPGGCSFGLPRKGRRNGLAETSRPRAVPDNAGDGRSHRGGQFRSRRRDAHETLSSHISSDGLAVPSVQEELLAAQVAAQGQARLVAEAEEEAVAEAEEAAEAEAEAEARPQEESLADSEGRYRKYLDNPFAHTHWSNNVPFFVEQKDKKNY